MVELIETINGANVLQKSEAVRLESLSVLLAKVTKEQQRVVAVSLVSLTLLEH